MGVLLLFGWCALSFVTAVTGCRVSAVPVAAAVGDPMLATLAVDGGVALAVLGVRLVRPRWVAYAPRSAPMRQKPRFWAQAVLCWGLVFLAGQSSALTLYGLLGSPGFDANVEHLRPLSTGLVVLLTVVVAPMGEEALFRGLLYPLLRRRVGTVMSMTVTALGFALVHGNLVQAAAVVPLALLLALVYEGTRALWPVVALHSVFNLAASVVPPAALQALATPLCSGLFLAACVLCLVRLHQYAAESRTVRPATFRRDHHRYRRLGPGIVSGQAGVRLRNALRSGGDRGRTGHRGD